MCLVSSTRKLYCILGRIGQCEAWCTPVSGFNPPSNTRHGLIPDGTPCRQNTYTQTFEEKQGFPRVRGISGYCVQGYCEVGTIASVRDSLRADSEVTYATFKNLFIKKNNCRRFS